MEIGNNIKKYRKKAELTQKELAQKVGCAEITIRQYESNKREPKFETLCVIAKALSIPVGYLIDSLSIGLMTNNDVKAFEYFWEYPEEYKEDLQEALFSSFQQLNESGKIEAVKRVEELTELPRYTTPSPNIT